MAIYNEILAGRFSRLMQKVFSMKGSNPAKQLSGEVMPVFPLFSGNENRFPESWNLYGFAATQAAVAAQFSCAQLRNPVGSGVIAVIHKISFGESVADILQAFYSSNVAVADLATVTNVFGLDFRNHAFSSVHYSQGTLAAPSIGQAIFLGHVTANVQLDYLADQVQEIPLLPGSTLRLSSGTVNTATEFTFAWRERPIEESEAF